MTPKDFLEHWQTEKPMYKAWGDHVCQTIEKGALKLSGKTKGELFKVTPSYRLKDDNSLLDKAFWRNKNYEYPYQGIEDKVGARFIVLFVSDIDIVKKAIEQESCWIAKISRNYQEERDKQPLLFDYQSIHYVLRPSQNITINNIEIFEDTPCEVQVRTLLQHAYAELTHDAIYKSKRVVQADVSRIVARSMALIEATDEIFVQVDEKLTNGPIKKFQIQNKLDSYYQELMGSNPQREKSSEIVLESFESVISENIISDIENSLLPIVADIIHIINENKTHDSFLSQSISLFIFWLIRDKKRYTIKNWPLDEGTLRRMATYIGESLDIA